MFSFEPEELFSPFAAAMPADGCTQCGICLSVCPTFQQSGDGEQSPMGRIRLMRLLDSGEPIEAVEKLESCLGCYACTRICPSRVDYPAMLDTALEQVRAQRPLPTTTRLMLWLSRRRDWTRRLVHLAAFGQYLGLRPLARWLGVLRLLGLARADRLLGNAPLPAAELRRRKRPSTVTETAALFTGCFTSVLDQPAQEATMSVLHALGVNVQIPPGQACCGALHRHNGQLNEATELAHANVAVFNETAATTIISTSSGCGASLRAYRDWFTDDPSGFRQPVVEISDYLGQLLDRQHKELRPLRLKVAVHLPCTLQQGEGQVDALLALLRRIPGLEVHPITDAPACCGAGGSHLLSHPQMADDLGDRTVATIAALLPDVVVSANMGCAIHLRAGLQRARLPIPVQHPVQLVAEALAV